MSLVQEREEANSTQPLHLSLKNCRTFDELELDIPEGLVAIVAPNGFGKSTIVDAIDVALFGPESRTLADWYPRSGGEDPLVITLTFEHGGFTYRVRRSFSPKGRGVSKVDLERVTAGERIADLTPMGAMPDANGMISHAREAIWEPITLESQTATQDYLESIVGISRDTFRASSFLAQGEAGRFAEAAPRARKAVLAEVVGLGQWDIWLDRARKEKKVCELALAQIAGGLEQAEQDLNERPLIELERSESIATKTRQEAALQDALDYLAMRRADLSQIEKADERRATAAQAVEDAQALAAGSEFAVNVREQEIRQIDVRLAERENLVGVASQLDRLATEKDALVVALQGWKERERIERDLAGRASEAEKARQAAVDFQNRAEEVLRGIGEEHCERCGQILGADAAERAADSYRKDAGGQLLLAVRFDDEAKELSARLAEMPTYEPDVGRLPMLERSLADAQGANARLAALAEAEARREAAVGELNEMRVELLSREQLLGAARANLDAFGPHDPSLSTTARREIAEHERFEAVRRAAVAESDRKIAAADSQLARLDKIAADVEESTIRRDALLTELDLLAAMERACGPNGVPALILETVAIPQVEVEATRILGLLGGPAYACELRTLRETKTGSLSDTLDVVLLTETGEAPYESFSGGERARIAFALRLALAQLLASRKGSSTGLLVIDELSGLDQQGVAALVSVLEDLATKIRTVLVVSHDAELRDSFENTILLEQVDGKSRVVNDLPLEVSA